ncbi:MAG TPA: SPOR domain-containing protein [Rectinemataceae bacterium]|nr:SPOR domain-containing protein [Rectinemataceae bacterium]
MPETKPGLAPKDVVLVPALSKGSFYIQVGVFGSSEAIQKAAGGFASGYPLAMERVEMKTGSAYRLYVGPLSRDESGVVLYRIKSLGFKDAFLRVGT